MYFSSEKNPHQPINGLLPSESEIYGCWTVTGKLAAAVVTAPRGEGGVTADVKLARHVGRIWM